jgi:hypothetical protein
MRSAAAAADSGTRPELRRYVEFPVMLSDRRES